MKEFILCFFSFLFGIVFIYSLLEIKNRCFISNSTKEYQKKLIKKLVRQTSRWSVASIQDENPVIAVLHSNYSAGYLWALKDIASKEDIEKATGINMLEFENHIVKNQDYVTRNLAKLCPNFIKTDDEYLSRLSGEK